MKPFAVDDVTYELELTRRGGEWMVKLVTPNEELLRGRKLETRYGGTRGWPGMSCAVCCSC